MRRVFMLGVVAGTAYAVWKWFESQRSETGVSWESQPAPYPPKPRAHNPSPPPAAAPVTATEPVGAQAAPVSAGDAWVEPADGTCPATHPVKAKMSSGIFHVEGGLNYDRIHPDRCYRDPAAAEADGLRKANR
ncbi:MAG TPA: hypothetical protein VFA62_06695 [Acidimicrobiia bacterium]|nr:hypothetical protein [Acidimicrobiia bacterium]